MKILVIQKKRIGDVLTSTIILEALKNKFPNSEIHYIIYENAKAVVQNNPFIDKIVIISEKVRKGKRLFYQFLQSIKKEKYDLVVDAYGKPNSVLIAWFSGAKKTISFKKNYSSLLLTNTVERKNIPNKNNAISHRMQLLEPLEIDIDQEISPKLFLAENEIVNAKERLSNHNISLEKPIVMISVVGSGEKKTLPNEYMAGALNIIADFNQDLQILLNYIPNQINQVKEIYNLINESTKNQIYIDYFDHDLRDFLATTKLCKALIGNEGGATNMAKALNVPTFSIYSPDVNKKDWNIFENGTTNVSVELDDFLPNIDKEKSPQERYLHFKPELFKEELIKFLDYNIKVF